MTPTERDKELRELTFSDIVQMVREKYTENGEDKLGYAKAAEMVDKAIEPQITERMRFNHIAYAPLLKIEKDLADSFESFRTAPRDGYMTGTSASSVIAAQQFVLRFSAHFDKLITADRNRVALEVRIDSLLTAKRRIYETDTFELGLALGIIDSELKKLGWTPGELKAQQEEA